MHSNAVNTPGFDNTLLAIVTVFQTMTLSGWVYVMYRCVDSTTYVSVLYFIPLAFFGGYFGAPNTFNAFAAYCAAIVTLPALVTWCTAHHGVATAWPDLPRVDI